MTGTFRKMPTSGETLQSLRQDGSLEVQFLMGEVAYFFCNLWWLQPNCADLWPPAAYQQLGGGQRERHRLAPRVIFAIDAIRWTPPQINDQMAIDGGELGIRIPKLA